MTTVNGCTNQTYKEHNPYHMIVNVECNSDSAICSVSGYEHMAGADIDPPIV
jgi:hypothetical protein